MVSVMWTSTQYKNSSGGVGVALPTVKFTIDLSPYCYRSVEPKDYRKYPNIYVVHNICQRSERLFYLINSTYIISNPTLKNQLDCTLKLYTKMYWSQVKFLYIKQ